MRRQPTERPPEFEIDTGVMLARNLLFLGAGRHPQTTYYHDSSLFANHSSLVGYSVAGDLPADRWSRDLGRAVLGYDGSDDNVALPNIGSSFGTSASVLAWVKLSLATPTDFNKTGLGFSHVTNTNRTHYPYTDGKLYISLYSIDTRAISGVDNSAFDKSKWHHVAITSTPGAGNYILYQNGSVTATGTGPATIYWPTDATIGKNEDRFLWGSMADVMIFNRALSPSEIRQLADPSNVMLSGLLRTRRKWWPVGATGTVLSVPNRSIGLDLPVDNGDSVDTMVAIGGTAPYSWQIVSQTLA